jgi:hypothetical protein
MVAAPLALIHFSIAAVRLVIIGTIAAVFVGTWIISRLAYRCMGFGRVGQCRSRHHGSPPQSFAEPAKECHQARMEQPRYHQPAAQQRPQPESTLKKRHKGLPAWPFIAIGLVLIGVFVLRVERWDRAAPATATNKPPRRAKVERPSQTPDRSAPAVLSSFQEPAEQKSSEVGAFWTTTVHGGGVTALDARNNALKNACSNIVDLLRSLNPPVDWEPSPDYVAQKTKTKWGGQTEKFDKDVGTVHEVSLTVELTPNDLRHWRASQRMVWLSQVFVGLVVLLGGVAGYIHLEQLGKGYYTGWLRLGAVSLVGAAGAAWWYFYQH